MQLRFKPSFLQLTPFGDLTRHLQACAGGLGQIVPDPAFLFVVFLSSNDWRKWVNGAFRKTPLFKNCRCEWLSLLYISKIEIYNPLSALLLTLVCHFYQLLLRAAIFVLNVAIATYFQRRQKEGLPQPIPKVAQEVVVSHKPCHWLPTPESAGIR